MLFLLQFPWHMDGVLGILLLVLTLSMDIICPTGQQLLELHKTMHEPLATTLLS